MLDPQILAQLGRRGDTMVAHISPQEAAILKMLGGSGGINPRTGLPEFFEGGGDEAGADGTGTPGGGAEAEAGSAAEAAAAAAAAGFGMTGINESLSGVSPTPNEPSGFYSGAMDDYLSLNTMKNVPQAFWEDYGPVVGGLVAGPAGYGAVAATQGKSTQAGVGLGSAAGGVVGGPVGAAIGGLMGYGIGYGIDALGGLSAPDQESVNDMSSGGTGQGSDYSTMAQNMVAGPTGVSTAQTVAQPASFDRDAFAQFGRGMINQQGSGGGTKASAASRGMGADSGQLAGQLAIQNKQRQAKMNEFNQLMSNPNMGYNDLAASLMNILA